MKAIYVFVFACLVFAMPIFGRAPVPPLEPMWVSGEERARVVQELRDQAEQIDVLERQLDGARDELRTCRLVSSA